MGGRDARIIGRKPRRGLLVDMTAISVINNSRSVSAKRARTPRPDCPRFAHRDQYSA